MDSVQIISKVVSRKREGAYIAPSASSGGGGGTTIVEGDKSASVMLMKLFTPLAADDEEIAITDTATEVKRIRANFDFFSVGDVSAKGISDSSGEGGSTGGATTLGGLVNVGLWADEVPAVDRIMYQAAGGTHWTSKPLSEIISGDMQGYATKTELNAVSTKLDSFLTGTDTDNIINKWVELEAFLAGMSETSTLSGLLQNKADKTITISAGAGLSGGGNLSADRTLSLAASGISAGTYTKVTVDVYGRVTGGTSLAAGDIPGLPWSKITSGKPTTLSGYGITDGINSVTLSGSGNAVTAMSFSGHSLTLTKGAAFLDKATFDDLFEKVNIGTTASPVYAIKAKYTFFSVGDVVAKGIGEDTGSGTGGTLSGLVDVSLSSPASGQILMYDGSHWVNSSVQQGLDLSAMWTELKKSDTANVIDISHIPNIGWAKITGKPTTLSGYGITDAYTKSDADGRYVNITGDTMTGDLIFNQSSTTGTRQIRLQGGDNDYGRFAVGGTATNAGWMEIATADDGIEPIYARQYTGVFTTIARTATLLDGSGNTQFPGTVQANYFTCRNTTLCTNLNADLLDGVHNGSLTANWLNANTKLAYGANGLNYFNFEGKAGTTANANVTPINGWYHILRMNHGNATGYFADIAVPLNNIDGIFWRQIRSGTNLGWYKLLDVNNYAGVADSRYVKKAGDTMTGDLNSNSKFVSSFTSSTWINSVSNSIIKANISSYGGIWCANTKNGRVVMSVYPSSDDKVYLGYATNSQISSGTNNFNRSTYWDAATGFWTAPGYVRAGSSDAYVLLGGGGHKALSTMQSEYDARYVNVTGDTMTGALNFANNLSNNIGDDCKFGDYNEGGCVGFQGINEATGISLLQQGTSWSTSGNRYRMTWNGSNMTSSSTAQWNNLNADLLDGYHQVAFLMGYNNSGTKYRLAPWGGSQDKNWRWVVRYVNTGGGTYQACTVKGTIWYIAGNHSQGEVIDIPFQAIFYPYGDTANSIQNISSLYLPQYCNWDLIRIVRYANNSWELQIRQPGDWSLISTEYTVRNNGGTVTAGQFSTSDIHSSTVVNSYNLNKNVFTSQYVNRADHADMLTTARTINGTSFNGTANITTSYWGTARTFYTNSHDSYRASAGVSVNGSGNVTLLLPNSIRCSDWFRSTGGTGWYSESYGGGWYMSDSNYIRNFGSKRLRIQTDTYDTLQLVRTSNNAGSSIAFYNNGGTFRGQLGCTANNWFSFDTGTATANQNVAEISPTGNFNVKGDLTAKASGSDIRLKKDIQGYDALSIIRGFRSVKYHWNDMAKANSEVYNNDYDQFGLIAQDLLAGGFGQWVKNVFKDYYTVSYERLIPVLWKGVQEVDSEVLSLRKRVEYLEKEIKQLRA